MKLFKSDAGVFQPVQKRQFGFERLEKNLEDWLGANPHLLGDDIMLIGRQVKTDRGAIIDLLALDQHGRVVVIELKRGRAPRDTVAQLNDYLTAVSGWSDGELARKANLIPFDREVNNLVRRFKEHFKLSRAPDFNEEQIGIAVAETFEPDFVKQIGGLRFGCRILQFSNFVTQGNDEFLLMNPLHDTTVKASANGQNGTDDDALVNVPAEVRERFSQLLDSVDDLLKDGACPEADGWRLHKSDRYVSGVFSRWRTNYEGITLFYEPEDDAYYVGTNCKVKHARVLSALLKPNKPEIEAALGPNLRWDMDSWWSLSERVENDPKQIAARIAAYHEHLKPYLDQAIPGRASTNGARGVTQLQFDFWAGFRNYAEKAGSKLRYPVPRPKGWMTINTGGFLYVAIASQNRLAVYIAIKGPNRRKNFELLKTAKAAIDKEFGAPLRWEPLPTKKESQIQTHFDGKLLDRAAWPAAYKWMLQSLERFHEIFVPRIERLKLKP